MNTSSSSSSSGGEAHPLRPYYQPSEDTFVASAPKAKQPPSARPGHSGAGLAAANSSTAGKAHTKSATVTIPRPSTTNRYASTNDDLGGPDISGLSEWTKASVLALALQYSSTCMAMPFEVGKLLLQVQWVPKDEVYENLAREAALQGQSGRRLPAARGKSRSSDPFRDEAAIDDEDDEDDFDSQDMAPELEEWRRASDANHLDSDQEDEDEEDAELSSPSDVEAYFRDVSGSSRPRATSGKQRRGGKAPATDASGYLMRRSLRDGESGARPEFVMPIVVRGGVWEMMKAVARGKEGWPGLWKGTFTSFLYDLLASGIQPVVSAFISATFIRNSLSTLPLPYVPHPKRTLALLVSSHLVTHLILSPIDLIRTRLIVQSTLTRHRKYSGPWDALRKIRAEEGGWSTMYGHPHLIFPALLDLTIRPFLNLASPLLIERFIRVEPTSSPVSYAFAELCINTASLLLSLPFETVRRRLQIQRRASKNKGLLSTAGGGAAAPSTPTKKSAGAGAAGNSASSSSSSASAGAPSTFTNMLRSGAGLSSSSTGVGTSTSSIGLGPTRGLRSCVETRPRPYTGVVEAIYRILTEETSQIPQPLSRLEEKHAQHHDHKSDRAPKGKEGARPQPQHRQHARTRAQDVPSGTAPATPEHSLLRSEILAPQTPLYATLGGVKSLYRGFTMAAGANLVVFFLTVVTGERVSSGPGAGGGWAEI
ncbi:mitochondrial carrier [Microstroma glucosiphilum]|uniref:Mitochondrial carrier n=1 Tax=Pseudomicrostroma glucosiphilum TaxID=1684307 RepID=A0A316UJ36_9BASI|nr:mitochondrial carrier [Pseudomicrostroma glucosiphilum]PWN23953.1 mitochondrial carrier [Pseudomicrostroma glucosiphilum]